MFKVSASLEHACLQSFTKVLDSPFPGRSFQFPDHLQSCATLLDCWWLTVVFILSTRLQNCNSDYLSYQFNSETCRRLYLTDAQRFYLSTGWCCSSPRMQRKTGYMPLQTLLRSLNDQLSTKLARLRSPWLSCVGAMLKAYYKLDK